MNKYKAIFTELHSITETDDEINDDYENEPKPQVPFLPAKKITDKRECTLVLDLDETLVHYFEEEGGENAYVKVRVGCENFIKELSEYCEIVIFTAGVKFYADIVIQGLDSKDKIDYRLYRQHTDLVDGINIKDLSKLGRDLSKVVIIDNIKENFQRQPDNGLHILDFEGDENDIELNYLLEDLLQLFSKPGLDVRKYLNPIRNKMLQRYTH
jgi:Dullard-like phosphatase family protein